MRGEEVGDVALFYLCLRKWQQFDRLDPAGQRIRRNGAAEQFDRPRDQEPSRSRIVVDGLLHGQDQLRRPLNLVDHGPVDSMHESIRIGVRELTGLRVIKGDETQPLFGGNLAGKRSLSGLPGADQGHDPRIAQGFADRHLRVALQ